VHETGEVRPQIGRAQPDLPGAPGRQLLRDSGKARRVEPVCLGISVQGIVQGAQSLERAAQIVPRLEPARVQGQGSPVCGDGLRRRTAFMPGSAETIQRRPGPVQQLLRGGEAGRQHEGFLQHRHRIQPAILQRQHPAERRQGFGRPAEGGGMTNPVQRFLVRPRLGQQKPQQPGGHGVLLRRGGAAGGDGTGGVARVVPPPGLGQSIHGGRLHAVAHSMKWLALALLLWAAPAGAAGDPKMALEDIPLDLHPLHRFADPGAAQLHCPGDEVVWANPATGYYHLQHTPEFTRARDGYACKAEALAAEYWDTNPFANTPHRSRSFPIDPSLRPDS